MAMGAPSPARTQRIYGLLSAVASKVTAAGEAAGRPFDAEAYLIRWFIAEHPALGYRSPGTLIHASRNPDLVVQLFELEMSLASDARRVLASEEEAYEWLRLKDPIMGSIPLEMICTANGLQKVHSLIEQLLDEQLLDSIRPDA